MSKRHDALGDRTCDRCVNWHNPQGADLGFCLRLIQIVPLGMAPASAIVDPRKPGNAVPVFRGFPVLMGAKDGCYWWGTRPINGAGVAPGSAMGDAEMLKGR